MLDEMVYDVETCAHENEIAELKKALLIAHNNVAEHEARESELNRERQQVDIPCGTSDVQTCLSWASGQAYDYAAIVESSGKEIAQRLTQSIGVVMLELSKKEVYVRRFALLAETFAHDMLGYWIADWRRSSHRQKSSCKSLRKSQKNSQKRSGKSANCTARTVSSGY